jgi:hypothetical protein
MRLDVSRRAPVLPHLHPLPPPPHIPLFLPLLSPFLLESAVTSPRVSASDPCSLYPASVHCAPPSSLPPLRLLPIPPTPNPFATLLSVDLPLLNPPFSTLLPRETIQTGGFSGCCRFPIQHQVRGRQASEKTFILRAVTLLACLSGRGEN